MTIAELREKSRDFPDDYIVVISNHKGEGAIIAVDPARYEKQKVKRVYHFLPDRRKAEE